MSRDSKRLLKALRDSCNVTQVRVRMAAVILSTNGIDAALDYVAGGLVPLDAAEEEWHENLQMESPL